jgi:hypothetical protein
MHARPRPSAFALVFLAVAACDAGGRAAEVSSPGPTLTITSPRMDQVLENAPEAKPKSEDAAEKERVAGRYAVDVLLDLREYAVGHPGSAGDGQHVHLIVDDEPYQAIYDVSKAIPLALTAGTHVVRVFPSAGPNDRKGARHHESRKNAGAFAWVRFHVRSKGDDPARLAFDATARPTLTYSRPKGDYRVGTPEHDAFLLDFYVTGTTLSTTGHRVRATLDGTPVAGPAAPGAAAGELVEWKPYVIPSPKPGEHEMVLELVDRDGRPVEGPFNRTARKFRVLER